MTLSPGARLGPYEILALIGRGGMGEVYRARDTRLSRDVAIKILPSAVAENPSRRARFLREAQAISQLSHPNICAIYDVGEQSDATFLVMEFIDGETLEQRLRLGPVPWRTALPWAMQIAAAIEAAHRRGIVHRDLKPANVMLAGSGVKLLDFGIAKLLEGFEGADAAAAPTASLTGEQTVVGTLQYMSPEQLEGRPVDTRTDVFSLGVTLYEILTGRKAFQGASPASVSAAILTADPPPISATASADPVTPAALDHVIRRALAKDPDERWQTARDMMLELRWILEGRDRLSPPAARGRRRVLLATAAALGVAALAAFAGWRLAAGGRAPASLQPVEFTIAAPPGTQLHIGYGVLSVSRDGRKVAFVAGAEANSGLIWWQSLDSAEQHMLPGTEGANGLFWSPDGKSIGFYKARDSLYQRIDLGGGPIVTIARVEKAGSSSAYWSEDGTITFADRPDRGGLYRVSAAGGEAVKLNAPGTMPRELPGGRFLYNVGPLAGNPAMRVGGAGLAEPVTLPIESNATYAAGHLVFRQSQTLVARPFDPRSLEFSGPPTPLAEDVAFNPGNGRTAFDASDTLLVYRGEPQSKLTWRDRSGASLGSIGEGRVWNPDVAPDGSLRVAVDRHEVGGSTKHVWIIDAEGRASQISRGAREVFPAWSADGVWLAYLSVGVDRIQLVRARASGAGAEEPLVSGAIARLVPHHYTNDVLIYEGGVRADLFALRLNHSDPIKDAAPINLTNTPSVDESAARVSPDGRWLAFTSNEGGAWNIWIQDFPAGTNKRRITTAGGRSPSWRQDGAELYYQANDGAVMAVPVNGPTAAFGTPVKLFKSDAAMDGISARMVAAAPDGQRFLVRENTGAPHVITVVVNWASRIR